MHFSSDEPGQSKHDKPIGTVSSCLLYHRLGLDGPIKSISKVIILSVKSPRMPARNKKSLQSEVTCRYSASITSIGAH